MNIKSGLFFGLMFMTSVLIGQNEWKPLSDAPNFIGALSKLDDVHFIDSETGWTINSFGEVFKTTDGGDTWEMLDNLDEYLRCVGFANENVGYVGSLQGSFGGPPSNSKFFKTTDGGDNWIDLTAAVNPEPIGICGLSVVDEEIVYGCGAYYGPARVYKTLDGGSTWTNIDMSAYASALVDVHFFNENEGYVVGAGNSNSPGGIILKTVDGGNTWETSFNNNQTGLLWKLQVLDNENLYASVAGTNLEGGAQVLISNDGGDNWDSKQIPIDGTQLQGVGFLTATHGFTGGFFDGVYETTDGGDTWELIEVGANYNRFQKINDSLMYASGHTIYKYSANPATSTSEEIKKTPNYGLDISPNPAKDRLSIKYHLGNNTHVNLAIYDSKGIKVNSLYDGWHTQGTFELEVSTESLPNGLYLIAYLSREGDVMRKVLIQH